MVSISAPNTSTSQGYIFRIFQHFATKFWNFTTFEIEVLSGNFVSCRDLHTGSNISLSCKLCINFVYLLLIRNTWETGMKQERDMVLEKHN